MGKIALIFRNIRSIHIGKDVTLVPQHLGRVLGLDVEIISNESKVEHDIPEYVDGMRFRLLKGIWPDGKTSRSIRLLLFLCRHAKEYDVIVLFHYHMRSLFGVLTYKIFNPKGVAYIKGDMKPEDIMSGYSRGRGIRGLLRRAFYRIAIPRMDVMSCEAAGVVSLIKSSDSPLLAFREGQLVLAPNGFDEAGMARTGTVRKSWEEKENIILTAGRMGYPEKNHEMLLDALRNVDLDGWKCIFAGKRTPEFDERVKAFRQDCPEKSDSVIMAGYISDKKSMWDLFNRARVFVLTSRYESAALVLSEAKWFGCYILTTDVGVASDLLSGIPCGEFLPQDDPHALAEALNRIISGKTNTDAYEGYDFSELGIGHCMRPVEERIAMLLKKRQ